MRILKRHLSDVVYRRMMSDLKTQHTAAEPGRRPIPRAGSLPA